jgi:two-component sensor histidine kinase
MDNPFELDADTAGGVGPLRSKSAGLACGSCDRLEEADHRIANHLTLLIGYLQLKGRELADHSLEPSRDEVRLLLESAAAQIGAVARLHRSLAVGGSEGAADLGEHLHEICEPFRSSLSGDIQIFEDFPAGCIVPPDQILPLTQIVAEVMTNAVKHAYPAGQSGPILVRCARLPDGTIGIDIIDQGRGLPQTFNPKTDGGLGFRLMRALGRQLDAELDFTSSAFGTHFHLGFAPKRPSADTPAGNQRAAVMARRSARPSLTAPRLAMTAAAA